MNLARVNVENVIELEVHFQRLKVSYCDAKLNASANADHCDSPSITCNNDNGRALEQWPSLDRVLQLSVFAMSL